MTPRERSNQSLWLCTIFVQHLGSWQCATS
nr:MAG TPA_asm: hypothetical protein [Caudoviricetes sp.]